MTNAPYYKVIRPQWRWTRCAEERFKINMRLNVEQKRRLKQIRFIPSLWSALKQSKQKQKKIQLKMNYPVSDTEDELLNFNIYIL